MQFTLFIILSLLLSGSFAVINESDQFASTNTPNRLPPSINNNFSGYRLNGAPYRYTTPETLSTNQNVLTHSFPTAQSTFTFASTNPIFATPLTAAAAHNNHQPPQATLGYNYQTPVATNNAVFQQNSPLSYFHSNQIPAIALATEQATGQRQPESNSLFFVPTDNRNTQSLVNSKGQKVPTFLVTRPAAIAQAIGYNSVQPTVPPSPQESFNAYKYEQPNTFSAQTQGSTLQNGYNYVQPINNFYNQNQENQLNHIQNVQSSAVADHSSKIGPDAGYDYKHPSLGFNQQSFIPTQKNEFNSIQSVPSVASASSISNHSNFSYTNLFPTLTGVKETKNKEVFDSLSKATTAQNQNANIYENKGYSYQAPQPSREIAFVSSHNPSVSTSHNLGINRFQLNKLSLNKNEVDNSFEGSQIQNSNKQISQLSLLQNVLPGNKLPASQEYSYSNPSFNSNNWQPITNPAALGKSSTNSFRDQPSTLSFTTSNTRGTSFPNGITASAQPLQEQLKKSSSYYYGRPTEKLNVQESITLGQQQQQISDNSESQKQNLITQLRDQSTTNLQLKNTQELLQQNPQHFRIQQPYNFFIPSLPHHSLPTLNEFMRQPHATYGTPFERTPEEPANTYLPPSPINQQTF